MLSSNFDAWMRSPRTTIMLISIVLLCYLEVANTFQTYASFGIAVNWVETPFLFMAYGVNILMSSIMFFITISEIPRKLSFQNYMLIRSNRRKWLLSQILYCVGMVCAMLLIMTLCILLFSYPYAAHGRGWSDLTRIQEGLVVETQTLVPQHVLHTYTPFLGTLYAMLPIFAFWLTLAMIILVTSLFNMPLVGLLLDASIILSGFILMFANDVYLPIQFSILQYLNPDNNGPEFYRYTMLGYVLLNAAMVSAIYVRISSTDLVFSSDNKF